MIQLKHLTNKQLCNYHISNSIQIGFLNLPDYKIDKSRPLTDRISDAIKRLKRKDIHWMNGTSMKPYERCPKEVDELLRVNPELVGEGKWFKDDLFYTSVSNDSLKHPEDFWDAINQSETLSLNCVSYVLLILILAGVIENPSYSNICNILPKLSRKSDFIQINNETALTIPKDTVVIFYNQQCGFIHIGIMSDNQTVDDLWDDKDKKTGKYHYQRSFYHANAVYIKTFSLDQFTSESKF